MELKLLQNLKSGSPGRSRSLPSCWDKGISRRAVSACVRVYGALTRTLLQASHPAVTPASAQQGLWQGWGCAARSVLHGPQSRHTRPPQRMYSRGFTTPRLFILLIPPGNTTQRRNLKALLFAEASKTGNALKTIHSFTDYLIDAMCM